ncbi:MAG: SPFH domain-containing protein [Thermofilaceae archaeon]|nr:SPFH domain-containing protein [Thermofilaceae archaeon]MDW8003532.1 SPFH domain-containing protein [Thermofilaceae archaeon]
MPQIIEWVNPGPEDIVWRYPNENITWGAQLIVHEYEVAVFFRDGKAYDVLGPGRHTLTTQNLPLLTEVLSRLAGYPTTPFKATVIFVSTKQFRGMFGGRTQSSDLAPLMFRGSYWFRAADPRVFVMEVVGGQGKYTTSEVSEFIRGFINERMIKHLATYDLATAFTRVDEVSFKAKAFLLDEMRRIGLELIDLRFEGIDTTPEYRDRLFWIKQTGAATYVLQTDTLKAVARELGKSPGAAVGAGVVMIPPLLQPPPQVQPAAQQPLPPVQPAASTAPTVKACPQCSKQVPLDALFCPYCGFKFQPAFKKCPSCGRDAPGDAVFCPYCGHRFG